MASTHAAMKARLGDTDYYILSMKAQELVKSAVIPTEREGWTDLTVEERYQRDLNYTRVRNQIAPNFANDNTRFFGAVIVAAENFGEEVLFEPLSDIAKRGLPNLYGAAASSMGFLTFRGGEVLIPLDGQHRLKAIEFAISGRDERGREIGAIPVPCSELANEDVTVILVPYELDRARRIFTRVNRYAKPTTTGQRLVTDDDDILAVLSREVANDIIGARLVKFVTNTLTGQDIHFTTLAIIYNCNEQIIIGNFPKKPDRNKLPSAEIQRLYRDKVSQTWEALVEKIDVFGDALSDATADGDNKRREIREGNLLGRPVAQECLVRAFVRLTNPPTNLTIDEACRRLNELPWAITQQSVSVWDSVLWTGGTDGRVLTNRRNLATDLIAYQAGEKIEQTRKEELLDEYLRQFSESEREGKRLPEPVGG